MITAVRLSPVDKKRNFGMRTYVSANSRTKYTSGTDRDPSPFRVVNSTAEVLELSEFPQFEILEFDDMTHLRGFIQGEMEARARVGLPAVRAAVMTGAGAGRIIDEAQAPRKAVLSRLPAAVAGPGSDTRRTNTGRQPTAETPSVEAPVAAPAKTEPKPKPPAKVTVADQPRATQKKGKAKAKRKRSTRPASEDN